MASILLAAALSAAQSPSDSSPECTDGMSVTDTIGYGIDGFAISNVKLEAVRWRRFEGLLMERGVRAKVGIATCGDLRGLRAVTNVSQGDILLHVPRRLILGEDYVEQMPVAALWNATPTGEPPLPLYAKFALLVLHEDRLGDDALLQPYIQLLPTADDFAYDGEPAWAWTPDELAVTESAQLAEDAMAKRAAYMEHPALAESTLATRWRSNDMPGVPPSRDELAWAVAVVTSRWVGSRLVPIWEMCNHGAMANARYGFLRDGSFVMLAHKSIRVGAQVLVDYGAASSGGGGGISRYPSVLSLLLHGFVADGAVGSDTGGGGVGSGKGSDVGSDAGSVGNADGAPRRAGAADMTGGEAGGTHEIIFVNIGPLLEEAAVMGVMAGEQGASGADGEAFEHHLGQQVMAGWLKRNNAGQLARFQPAGMPLLNALRALGEVGMLPARLSPSRRRPEDAYAMLLRLTLNDFSTSLEEDLAMLECEANELPVRRRLALQFRVVQKRGLELALRALGA